MQCVKGESKILLSPIKLKDDNCTECDSKETCCTLSDGSIGCCPYNQATCCSDHAHCCPHGYTCDLEHMQCVKGESKILISPIKLKDDNCTECDSKETCCTLSDGSIGCCPYNQATCCSDHAHCCPHGYTCDLEHMQCVKGESKILLSSISSNLKDDCPSGTCDQSQTCCALSDGSWGCCPYKDADCCSDHAHCCPHGYDCDLVHQQCVKGNLPLTKPIISNDCDCSSNSTCCPIDDGKYGCCPYTQASCCSDKAHCCANGYKCDLVHQQCVPNEAMFKKFKMYVFNRN
jgi:hypothetical protein